MPEPPLATTTTDTTSTDVARPTYFAKIGMVLVQIDETALLSALDAQWRDGNPSDEYYETLLSIHQDVEQVLKNCPDVRNVRRLGELRKEHYEPFEHHGLLENERFLPDASAPLAFEVFLPKAERRYAFEVRYEETVIERAHVLFTGTLFLAFAELDDETSPQMFGQEIREFLVRKLNSPRWHAVVVPPCPIHPDIWVRITPEKDNLEFEVPDWTEVRVAVPEKPGVNIEDFFDYFLTDTGISSTSFYSAATLDQKLSLLSWSIQETLDTLADEYRLLLSLSWHRIRSRLKVMHSIRAHALELQLQSNDFASTELRLKRERRTFSPQATESWHRTPFRMYFFRHFRTPELSLPETREVVQHMTDIVTNRYLQYYTVLAAILGGVVGATVTRLPDLCSFIAGLSTKTQ